MGITTHLPTLSGADLDQIRMLAETLELPRPAIAASMHRVHRWAVVMRDIQTRNQFGYDAGLHHRMREVIQKYIDAVDQGKIKGGKTYLSFCAAMGVVPKTAIAQSDDAQPRTNGHDGMLDQKEGGELKTDMGQLIEQLARKLGGK